MAPMSARGTADHVLTAKVWHHWTRISAGRIGLKAVDEMLIVLYTFSP